jgi:hypothetical protein
VTSYRVDGKTMLCQNGYPVLTSARDGGFPRLRNFIIPLDNGPDTHLILRDGSVGFNIALAGLSWHTFIEPLNSAGHPWDEWGHNIRPIRGKTTGYSNHSGGTAADYNATQHPRGVAISKTFSKRQIQGIRDMLGRFDHVLGWGGNYHLPWNVDGMHIEAIAKIAAQEKVARRLMTSKRGKIIIAANPGLKAVILS